MRRVHAIAVFAALLFPAADATGQARPDRCPPGDALWQCVNRYWDDPEPVSSNWLDTMDTWTRAADWKDTEECSKVLEAAKQTIVFGNRERTEIKPLWPVYENIGWGTPVTAGVHGEHFHDESWFIEVPGETPGDTFRVPHHGMMFTKHDRATKDIWNSWKHENGHHAGFKSEAKADSLEACAERNEEREDSIWKEKERDRPDDDDDEAIFGGDPSNEGTVGKPRIVIVRECHVCYYRPVTIRSSCRDEDGKTVCDVRFVLVRCERVGDGDCGDHFGFAPGAFSRTTTGDPARGESGGRPEVLLATVSLGRGARRAKNRIPGGVWVGRIRSEASESI